MKVWFEALTGKQALLFHYLGVWFEENGHQTLFTARNYDYVLGNFKRLRRKKIHSIGGYGGASLFDKLITGSERIIELAKLIKFEKPDLLLSFSSPDASRVAFGLGIPIILLNDTPHATAAARLTMALSEALVHPESIDVKTFQKFGARNLFSYYGVDEILWTKSFEPDKRVLENLALEKNKYIVVRCEESKASYFQSMYPEIEPGSTIIPMILERLTQEGVDLPIVAFPRYEEQFNELKRFRKKVIIPESSVDTMSLLYYAKVSMTGGGTMGREGALLGTPTIYSFPRELEVSTFTKQAGFPIYHCPDHMKVADKLIELIGTKRMGDVKRKKILEKLESPLDGVKRALIFLEEQT